MPFFFPTTLEEFECGSDRTPQPRVSKIVEVATSTTALAQATTDTDHCGAPSFSTVGNRSEDNPQLTETLTSGQAKLKRESWARETLPGSVCNQLWAVHGKEKTNVSFKSTTCFRHILPHLFASGFLSKASIKALCNASRPAKELSYLLRRYRHVDFSPLRTGLPPENESPDRMMSVFCKQVTACFLHFRCWTPHVIRYIGGQHTGQHRRWKHIRDYLRAAGVDESIISDLVITLRDGAPRFLNAEFTEKNFLAALVYGNHPSVSDSEELVGSTKASLEKDVMKGFALGADPRLVYYVPNLHLTPIGLIEVPGKKPRLYFDSSFRPKIWSMAINDVTDLSAEPDIHFAGAFVSQLAWIWNLRITYPTEEIFLGDDDVSGAFRQVKYNINVVSLHACLIFGQLFMYTGQTFGDSPSPPNWEPIVTARKALAQKLWLRPETESDGREVLPSITLADPPSLQDRATFVQPVPDSKNAGVMTSTGDRIPPPYPHHVDDCYYADIRPNFYKTVVSSLLALYSILGKKSGWNSDVVSWDKFISKFTHERRMNGWIVNSRTLTIALPNEKRSRLLDLLTEWSNKKSFAIRELAVLLGVLMDHSRPLPWFRARFSVLFYTMRTVLNQRYSALKFYEERKRIQRTIEDKLPADLRYRLGGLVATEVAVRLWKSKIPIPMTQKSKNAVTGLLSYASDPSFRWSGSIGHMIHRDPDFTGYGDASLTSGGGYNRDMQFYFLLFWGPRFTRGFSLSADHKDYRHINDMEFVVIIVQLAAIITRMRDTNWSGLAPIAAIWSDNTSSSAWAAAVHARSPRMHGLVELYSQLLEASGIKTRSDHISSSDNHQADFISRLEPSTSPSALHLQISRQYTEMTSFQIFLPASDFLQLIEAKMFSDAPRVPLDQIKRLGRFVDVASLSSNTWLGSESPTTGPCKTTPPRLAQKFSPCGQQT